MNNVTFFASGSNHSGEIRALSLVPGANIGVVASYVARETYPIAYDELERFVETGRKVFIDSGAFAEVKFPGGVPTIVKPLTDKHWRRCFRVYAEAALTHGANAYVVAPDCVAHQTESLERLTRYAEEMREIFDLGATILVPIQKGALTMAEFHARAGDILNAGVADGGVEFTPSIPMKKDATTLTELRAFVEAVRPASIHLLGLAPDTDKGEAAIATILEIVPNCRVSCDACLIMRWVGKTNGPGGGPRRFTAINDVHVQKLALDVEALNGCEIHVRKAISLFLAAQTFWTDLGLAGLPIYDENLHLPEMDLEPAYLGLAVAVFAKPIG